MTHVASPTSSEEGTFTSPAIRGVTFHRLSVYPTAPAGTRARLAVVHGYGDHAGRFAEAMAWLAARGVACHAFDLRGHGRSSGRRGYVRAWDEYLVDLRAFLDLHDLAPRPGGPPLFLLGHSHGGLVVAAAGVRGLLEAAGIDGAILSAPYLRNALPLPRAKVLAGRVANLVCPWLLIPSGIKPEMLSSDAAMVEASRHDPLLLRSATPRWFLTHRRAQSDVTARAGQFRRPLLVLQGEADPIADPRGAAAFHAAAGSADKTLVTYPGLLHEILRETSRARVYADVLDWIDARLARRPDA